MWRYASVKSQTNSFFRNKSWINNAVVPITWRNFLIQQTRPICIPVKYIPLILHYLTNQLNKGGKCFSVHKPHISSPLRTHVGLGLHRDIQMRGNNVAFNLHIYNQYIVNCREFSRAILTIGVIILAVQTGRFSKYSLLCLFKPTTWFLSLISMV